MFLNIIPAPVDEEEPLCICEHKVSHKSESLWIKPPKSERKHSPQQPRLYCKTCGRLQYTGSAIAKELGFYVNMLKEIKQKVDVLYKRGKARSKMTQVHMRLIIDDLRSDPDFLDAFSNQQYTQYDFFKACVMKHCDIEEYVIDLIYEKMR
jgi:hypothetical protein